METEYQYTSQISLVERDRKAIWHPFTQAYKARKAIPIVKGEGVYLYAEDGKRYLDGISSWWTNLHGHCHSYIVEAISKQLESLEHVIFADFTHEPAVTLAERLLKIYPGGMSKVFYSDNGSTAVEVALKMALQYWHNKKVEKREVVSFKSGYFGDTFGAMSAAGKNSFNNPFWTHLFNSIQIELPKKGNEEASLKQLESILETGNVACFIFEPLVLGAGGMIIYSAEALNALLRLCKEYEVITIADEVMTGFGRTGSLFACESLEIKPDIVCLSKGLTGGFLPLGATLCKQFIYEAFLSEESSKALLHGHTYTGNPLSCSAANASLDLLENKSCDVQRKMIENIHNNFCMKWKDHPRLLRCECQGTILVLEYKTEGYSGYFNSLRDRLYNFFLGHQILLRPLGNVLYVMPPYCITEEQLSGVYDRIETTLEGASS